MLTLYNSTHKFAYGISYHILKVTWYYSYVIL